MNQRTMELAVGIFMAVGIGALMVLALQVSNLNNAVGGDGYEVTARFENIGQLKVRSAVKMSGVTIGQVSDISIDPKSLAAQVTLRIDRKYNELPADTSAQVFTSGMLGEQYIALEPGGEENFLSDGSTITLTQSALVLEQLIGQFMFKQASGDNEK
jgi:phospholipid/cholesterol/gamma-HCH transport system substrate-binding protein